MNLTPDDVIKQATELFKADKHIDLVKLAQSMNIDVYAKEEDANFNAEIGFDSSTKSYFIVINANQPLVRQRFSIAHELSHFILHKEVVKKRGFLNRADDTNVDKKMEQEADHLAAEILMPEELLTQWCKEHKVTMTQKIDEDVINSIADYFKVSRTVALLRLRHLNFYVPYISFS